MFDPHLFQFDVIVLQPRMVHISHAVYVYRYIYIYTYVYVNIHIHLYVYTVRDCEQPRAYLGDGFVAEPFATTHDHSPTL